MRVLYYTNVPIHETTNGGNLCCRNHVQRLAQEKTLEVFAVVTQSPACEPGTREFLDSLGVPLRFVPYTATRATKSFLERKYRSLQGYWQSPSGHWRKTRVMPTQVQEVMDEMIAEWKIEALVIDYYVSVMHLKLPRFDVRTCITKLNREAEFYADQMTHGQSAWYRFTHQFDIWRLKWLEKKIENSVGKVVVLGRPDMPRGQIQSPAVCITPYLDKKPRQWSYTKSQSIFFVGNILHYPNKLAMEWLATRLAPEMLQLCPDIRIKIVGCKPENAPPLWKSSNLDFLGPLDREGVENLFCISDLLICPIENDFGLKFKTAEAIAFGTPLLASVQTLLGLPYLSNPPAINLQRPRDAALLIRDLTSNKERLMQLSAAQTRDQAAFIETQKAIWTTTLLDTPVMKEK